jgi:hypothetical protein
MWNVKKRKKLETRQDMIPYTHPHTQTKYYMYKHTNIQKRLDPDGEKAEKTAMQQHALLSKTIIYLSPNTSNMPTMMDGAHRKMALLHGTS